MRPSESMASRFLDGAVALRTLPLRGGRFHCPCCGWSFRRFTAGGRRIRTKVDGYCPRCNSKPRHRWLWLHLPAMLRQENRPSASVLHIAPAHSTFRALSRMQLETYVTAGLDSSTRYSLRMDLTRPALTARFDVVICIHVLEHLDDDHGALVGLTDLVESDGIVAIGVPTRSTGPTLEDPSITDPVQRERLFGEPDHRRWYGLDIIERIERAGLKVVESHLTDDAPAEQRVRCGLKAGEGLFICRRAD